MHILHVTPYYAPAYAFGGVPRAVEGMARALVRAGHRVSILTTDAGSQSARLNAPADDMLDGVRVLRIPNRSVWLRGRANLSSPFGIGQQLEALMQRDPVDIIHTHEFRTAENLLIAPVAVKHGIPMVLSPHGTLTLATGRGAIKAAWDRWLSPRAAPHIAAVIALTDTEAGETRAAWASFAANTPPIHVIPNGVEPDEFAQLPPRDDPTPTILYMGRLHPRKGVDLLLRAFLQANLPDTRLVIAGPDDGLLPTLKQIAQNDPRVQFTGYLDAQARLHALANADVFVLPARGEGMSIAALEALAAGVPVILSPECGLNDVEAAGAGVIVPPEIEYVSYAISRIFSDSEQLQNMSKNARLLVRSRYTWDQVASELVRVYRRVLENH